MKFELTNPKAWKAVSERNIPMAHKIKVYEKLGGAYRLGENGGEQVFNDITELLKSKLNEEEGSDHEVGMALNQLDDIIKNATELKGKIGTEETNLAGWIQDHISQAQNFINQANTGFHKLDNSELSEGFKHIISVETPTQVVSKPVQKQIEDLAKKGVRSKEIGLKMGFVGNNKAAENAFQKLKNKIYFALDSRYESINEGVRVEDERHIGNGLMIIINDNGKMISAYFKNKKNADKYNRNNEEDVKTILDLAKKAGFGKSLDESVNEVKYPTDLEVGSVIMGQGFTMLKGIEGGKYYKVVEMDDYSATLVPSDKNGNVKGSKKVRHKLDSIEGGIKTAKRGDENGIVVIKESINEGVSPKELEKIKSAVEAASSFMSVGSELKKMGIRYIFATEPLPIYIVQPTPNNKVAIVNKRYATKPDFVVGDIAVGVMD